MRQKDLNRMTQHALEREGVPIKRANVVSFTEIVPRSIDEQFIEPLFIDEGNLRRYSYEYVDKAHALRFKTIDFVCGKKTGHSLARNMDQIIDKIVNVYGCILKDNFAFEFRNDD